MSPSLSSASAPSASVSPSGLFMALFVRLQAQKPQTPASSKYWARLACSTRSRHRRLPDCHFHLARQVLVPAAAKDGANEMRVDVPVASLTVGDVEPHGAHRSS
ncbi:uncharacterized protein SPSK_05718 [Sporothrix schenckii 1099-18]|uniref:Uncharacterized protein n=1 Tax=Sporothrix schenckii 1099-18 TaxID=1397361 RepID=A0A0F2LU17_SPOSC|nr:uncharacterized protein SPSK_05718 [Sporothrix schenckii 1099-18]KJR80958.1 hypothetical protein SPSK_05718 [Sporothrix schenckii 1099-18]